MRSIELLRTKIKTDYFTNSELSPIFGNGPARHNRVSQMLRRKEILKLKNGAYVFNGIYSNARASAYYIANMLFGPSYVSTESALSYYGLIPEGVSAITSVTVKRPKKYQTALGHFIYQKIPFSAFIWGVELVSPQSPSSGVNQEKFMLATKEKALLDKLYLSYKGNDYYDFCLESLRIEQDDLHSMNVLELLNISKTYGNACFAKRVTALTESIATVQASRLIYCI